MINLGLFIFLLVFVNSMVTSLFVMRYGANFKKFLLGCCGITLILQIIAYVCACLLQFKEDSNLPAIIIFILPVVIGSILLVKAVNKITEGSLINSIRVWQAIGILTLGQYCHGYQLFGFFLNTIRYHPTTAQTPTRQKTARRSHPQSLYCE